MNKTALNSQKEKHSMLSLRRATFVGLAAHRLRNISIHALLAESDRPSAILFNGKVYFYPRSPCGERPLIFSCYYNTRIISIHALLAESDNLSMLYNAVKSYFYPRSPCGERLFALLCNLLHHDFYPRSPCGERPGQNLVNSVRRIISIHALLAESDYSWYCP